MSYLDKLLQGVEVEWKTLGEVCELSNIGVDKKIIENFSAEAPQEIPKEVSSLVTEVAEMSQAVNGNIASIQAILSFLGMNIPLSNLAQRMFLKIQNDTRRQNVYQDNAYQNNEGDTEL